MYQHSYAEELAENPNECRARERMALEHAIQLLDTAKREGPQSRAAVEALDFVSQLWNAFIHDLIEPGNDLPSVLRADLISVGLWITKEAALIRCGKSGNFDALIEVCSMIRNGLR
ncbi:MAG TPA: flagellar biosynthesis regulator FlaF [Methylocella sp.]|nr:flagellar biosynthesis regulator FlaF [Methylocella sp.]